MLDKKFINNHQDHEYPFDYHTIPVHCMLSDIVSRFST